MHCNGSSDVPMIKPREGRLLTVIQLPNIGLGVCYLLCKERLQRPEGDYAADRISGDHVYYFRRHIWDVPPNTFVPATIVRSKMCSPKLPGANALYSLDGALNSSII